MQPLGPTDPQVIGEYRLVGRLGAGGMGKVYLARSSRGRTVAIKLVLPELAHEPQFRERFRNEVEAARRIGGQWTAPVLDADMAADTPWVATGYVAGPSLTEVVRGGQHGPLPERSVLALANGLARALRDIHAAGLIHRDVKPSNVLITIDGPRVIDFGIARAAEVTSSALTRTGAVVGSPGFMSPEQCRGDRLTPASDVFCLGSVLAFAATGRSPFGGPESAVHVLMLRILQDEKDLSGVGDGLRELVTGCLAPLPTDRPTVEQIIAATDETVRWDDQTRDPWLPAGLLAGLGRQAVGLLDSEEPARAPAAPAFAAPLAQPPAPYAAPTAAAYPAAPTPPVGGFGPTTPMAPTPPGRRRGGLLAAALVGVLAVGGVVGILANGGSDAGDDPSGASLEVSETETEALDPEAIELSSGEDRTTSTDRAEYDFRAGQVAHFDNGMNVSVGNFAPYTPSEYAAGIGENDETVQVTVTVENTGQAPLDLDLRLRGTTDSGAEADDIIDSFGELMPPLELNVSPGETATGELGFAIPPGTEYVDLLLDGLHTYADTAVFRVYL
ncbi:serine/threonine-protein kinase [Streptomyces millisiae]|uniref:Serine/threonine-protein kinase n=1 Tax=Streptomyces millisiae TaxID=3075542 RepID=A0ABU2LI58_9ACTN|nr:serine/threonine-protein kinase [Streptomyces sp. DSM 44918]MDT0316923.1 serine/threonine-protein kinase [Streptomyces sp. DSM 44918]